MVAQFPQAPRMWTLYMDIATTHLPSNDPKVQTLFFKAVATAKSLDVYRAYLTFVKRAHPIAGAAAKDEDPAQIAENRVVVKQAYDYVLSHVMHDKDCGPLWAEYVAFLKAAPVSNQFEDQAKQDELRATYIRAVSVPHANIEGMWREWDVFENGRNKGTAKKLLSERSATYLAARTALKTLRSLWDPLDRPPAMYQAPTFSREERQLLAAWRAMLTWERSNPLKIDDARLRYERVAWMYWQAVAKLPRYPELWYEFATFAASAESSRGEEAVAVLRAGCEACPDSLLLHFSLADTYEAKDDIPRWTSTYNSLLTHLTARATSLIPTAPPSDADLTPAQLSAKLSLTLAYLTYMRATARKQGIAAHRTILKRARSSLAPHLLTWHYYVCSALLEYHAAPDAPTTVTRKLLAYACAQFKHDPAPVLVFADWLHLTRDQTNLVSTLVQAVKAPEMGAEGRSVLGQRLAKAYAEAGDLRQLAAWEAEMAVSGVMVTGKGEAPQADDPMAAALEAARRRYTFMDLDVVGPVDLGVGKASAAVAAAVALGAPSVSVGWAVAEEAVRKVLNGIDITNSGQGDHRRDDRQVSAAAPVDEDIGRSSSSNERRRILDEWTPSVPVVMPKLPSDSVPPSRGPAAAPVPGAGWTSYRPPRMSEDEERAINDRIKQLQAQAIREERERERERTTRDQRGSSVAVGRGGSVPPGAGNPPPPPPPPPAKMLTPMEIVVAHANMLPPAAMFNGPLWVDPIGLLGYIENAGGIPSLEHIQAMQRDLDLMGSSGGGDERGGGSSGRRKRGLDHDGSTGGASSTSVHKRSRY
ncbi:hypothetical protein BCR44DRAFT_1449545 [Catenaria anguillulae PL171]|uniref:Suppressor of forked domain-containing protein n=1 Tax=Catenaria anguillulae PL171 TaxID=765915 RepID=A0A1Y2H4Q3_9FUNG|nr:hypothetical protein BCR44DRAFT_1449545 [Catenaria anguillulae PL171]